MNALIQITTGEQGSPVVSARELYSFLGFDLSQWSRWSKKNIIANPFSRQGEDWEQLDMMSKTSESGRPSTDFALTLDFSKRLSMLARTEKGEEARRYFLECEKELKQTILPSPPTLTTEQMLLQILANQQEQLNQVVAESRQLRAEVQELQTGGNSPFQLPGMNRAPRQKQIPGSHLSLRKVIGQKINEYCLHHGATQSETYNYLYKRLYDVYGVNVYRLNRNVGESLLDALEKYGHVDRIYSLIMAELSYAE